MWKIKYYLLISLFILTLFTSLWLTNIYFTFVFSLGCWIILPIKRLWDNNSNLLLAFALVYSLCEYINGYVESGFVLLAHVVSPVAFYCFGRWIVVWYKNINSRILFLSTLILAFLLQLFVLTFQDIMLVGLVNNSRRMLLDAGKEDSTLSATLYGLMSSVGIGAISSIFTKNIKFLYRLFLFVLSLLSLLIAIHLVNRTGVVVLAIGILFSFVYSTKMSISRIFPALLAISMLALIVYETGIIGDDLIDAYISRENESGVESSNMGGRLELWVTAISNLVIYPFGWHSKDYFAHNLWLDIARVGGWIPFIMFTKVTISVFKKMKKVMTYRLEAFTVVLFTIMVCMLVNSSVEPVMEASNIYFFLLICFFGMIISL